MQTSSALKPSVKAYSPERVAVEIRGRGRVQRVGFRLAVRRTDASLARELSLVVIEGEHANANDGEYIRVARTPVVQNNTGTGCHLDAEMVTRGVSELKPGSGAVALIENVGNLVCPIPFDLTLANIQHVYSAATMLEVSALNGEGMGAWYDWIRAQALASRQFGLV